MAAITVHGRTVRQGYQGNASWEFLRELKAYAPDRVLLGSGDLFSAQACVDMLARTGVNGVTIARGAIGNPWIFEQFHALSAGEPLPPPPSLFEQREVIGEHYGSGRRTVWAKTMLSVDAQIRHQILSAPSAARGSPRRIRPRSRAQRLAYRPEGLLRPRPSGPIPGRDGCRKPVPRKAGSVVRGNLTFGRGPS